LRRDVFHPVFSDIDTMQAATVMVVERNFFVLKKVI